MAITTRSIEYQHNNTVLEGFFAVDDSNPMPCPGILIAHMASGRVPFVCDIAVKLAALGYAALAHDMFGKDVIADDFEQAMAFMQPFTDDRALLQARMQLGLKQLAAQAEVDKRKMASIGYCFGGLCSLDLARSSSDILGAVSFHGLLSAPGNIKDSADNAISAKILVLHGQDDPFAPIEQVLDFQKEMSAADADWQLHSYGNTQHAFTFPGANNPEQGLAYNEAADKRSWQSLLNFLDEIFA